MQNEHTEFTFFLLQEKDVSELAALEAACFPTPWTEEQYRKILKRGRPEALESDKMATEAPQTRPHKGTRSREDAFSHEDARFHGNTPENATPGGVPKDVAPFPSTPVFGIRAANGELAAYICLGVYPITRELEVYNIAVSNPFRKRGLGKRLLAHALEEARRLGIERALLEVRPSNDAALALYASTGFAICGNRKKYYKDSGEDALVLACDLGSRS